MLADRITLFAACAPGLEPALADEVRRLDPERYEVVPGGVEATGPRQLVYRANLELGLAKHVLLRVDNFVARRFDRLVDRVAKIEWPKLINGVGTVHVTTHRSRLYHTGAIEERVREGIGKAFGGTVDEEVATEVHVRFHHDRCTLSINTSGDELPRRGYRRATGKAPLSADLARALVIASGWNPDTPLVDPFSGSGTVAIEAALLARRVAPGLERTFEFAALPWFDPEAYAVLVTQLRAAQLDQPLSIVASDRDAGVTKGATENAERAGVADAVSFTCTSVSDAPGFALDAPVATVVTNPPFGHRIAKGRDLRPLYQRFGTLMSARPEWGAALVVRERRLAAATGLTLEPIGRWQHGGSGVHVLVRRTSSMIRANW
ncbi:MAG: THUMP domain-containing protein [Deltaproteobacteria bacterium]